MFSLFDRAHRQLNLSPAERAVLKLVEGFLVAGLVAALPVVAQLLAQQSVDWAQSARIAGGVFVMAVLLAVLKYAKAHGDLPLEEIITPIEQAVEAKVPPVPPSATPVPSGGAL